MRCSEVSVVIPTYNCARYLDSALESIRSQVGVTCETILVDDNSTDETEARFSNDQSVRYVRNEKNLGPGGARNRGIALAKAKYIAFLDADDGWLPGKLSSQVRFLDQNPEFVAASGFMRPWRDQEKLDPVVACSSIEKLTFRSLVRRNRICTPTVVVRREALESVGGFNETLSISEDYDLWLRLARLGPFVRLNTVVARYRTRNDGASAGNRERTYLLHLDYVRSIPSRFADIAGLASLARQHIAYCHLDHSYELADMEGRIYRSLKLVLASLAEWPRPLDPTSPHPFLRLRRVASLVGRLLTSSGSRSGG